MKKEVIGYIYLIAAVTLLSLLSMVVKYIYMLGVPETSLSPLFVCIAASGTGSYVLLRKRDKLNLKWNRMKYLIIQGVFGMAMLTAGFYKSLIYLDTAVAIMILYCNCIFVFLFNLLIKHKKMSRIAVFSMGIVIIGLILSTGAMDGAFKLNIKGIVYACLGSVGYAVQNINVEENLSDLDVSISLFFTQLIGAACLVLVYSPTRIFDFSPSPTAILILVAGAFVTGLLPLLLQYKGVILVGAYKASIISTMELPITALFAYSFLAETISYSQLIGMIFIVLGSFNIQRDEDTAKSTKWIRNG